MVREELRGDQVRRVRGGGIVVYDSPNAAAVVANPLWTMLHDEAAKVRVDGKEIPLRSHDLAEALRRRL